MLGELLSLEVIRVELMDFGMHFDSFGSLCAPVPGILVSLVVDIELEQEGLYIALLLDG